jgi:hypothetical protein
LAIVYAVSGLPCPETITVRPPYTSGVIALVVARPSNGVRHNN